MRKDIHSSLYSTPSTVFYCVLRLMYPLYSFLFSVFNLLLLYFYFYNILCFVLTREAKDDNLEQELSLADKRNKREIRLLEGEIPLWQVIVEKLNAASEFMNLFHFQ